VVIQFLCFPTTEPTKPQRTLRTPQTAIFPLMLRGAGCRSPTLAICRNRLSAQNAKRRHGCCSEIICFSNMLSAARHVHRLNDLQVPLATGYWNVGHSVEWIPPQVIWFAPLFPQFHNCQCRYHAELLRRSAGRVR
jgi:hypothetical protein